MRFFTAITALAATAAISSASPVEIEEREAVPDHFTVYFGPGTSRCNAIEVIDGHMLAQPALGYYNRTEPLVLSKDFVFTSIFDSPTDGQALIAHEKW